MKRLTKRGVGLEGMIWFIDHENNELALEPCEMSPHHNRLLLEKVAKYEDKEENDLIIQLPCKIGDMVYAKRHSYDEHSPIVPYQITNLSITQNKKGVWTKKYTAMLFAHGKTWDKPLYFSFDDIGKTVFLEHKRKDFL